MEGLFNLWQEEARALKALCKHVFLKPSMYGNSYLLIMTVDKDANMIAVQKR